MNVSPNPQSSTTDNKWLVLVAVAINGLIIVLDTSIVNIAFPRLTKIFDTSPSIVLWVTVVYSLMTVGLMPILGRIGDIYGRRRIFLLGYFLFTLGLALCAVSQSIHQLILARVVQGIGGAMNMALGFALVTDAFPANERGRALGIMGSVFAIGPLLGFTIGGLVLDSMGWRAIFWVRLPICAAGLIMTFFCLKQGKIALASKGIDYLGAATLFGSLSSLILFLNNGGRRGFASPLVIGLGCLSVLLFGWFIVQENKSSHPLVDLNIFRNRRFTIGSVGLMAYGLAQAIQMFVFPYYLIDGLGQTASEAGMLLSIAPLVMIAGAPLAGWLSDLFGTKLPCALGLIIFSLGLFLFSRMDSGTDLIIVIINLMVMAAGATLFQSPNTSLLMGAAPKTHLGSVGALITTMRQTGVSAGIALAGLLLSARSTYHEARFATEYSDPIIINRLSLTEAFTDTMFAAMLLTVSAVLIITFVLDRRKDRLG